MKRVSLLVFGFALAAARPAAAQSSEPLANLVPNLILREVVLPGGADPGSPHAGHFTLLNPTFGGSQPASVASAAAISAVESFNDAFRSQFTNFPLGSSAGGFTYTFDQQAGTYTRASQSFGPAYAERAITIGRKKVGFAFNYQHSSFDTFGGQNLDDGSITFFLPHTDCCNAATPPPSALTPGFEGDLVQAALHLKAKTDTFDFFVNYGLTDKLDVGMAVPFSRVELDASVHATIIRLSTAATPLLHTFVQGQDVTTADFGDSQSAAGIGDLVLRSKYRFYSQGSTGLAAAVDLRLPTGDETDLLGIGTTQAKLYFIASGENGRFAPHVNVGYTVSGTGNYTTISGLPSAGVSDEFNLAGGIEYVATPKLTLNTDYIGRTLIDSGKVSAQTVTFQFRPGAGPATDPLQTSTVNPLTNQPYEQLARNDGSQNLSLASVGFKYNAATNFLVTGNVLFPLNKGGLRDRATFAFGFDYAF